MRIGRKAVVGAGLAAGGAGVARARGAKRHVAYPPGPDAIAAEGAQAAAERLLAQPRVSRRDLTMPLAPTLSTSVDPLLHGRRYFPRMLADIAAATDSIHLLIYGYKPGEIGTTFLDVLGAKVRAGVEVRLQVDAIGSEVDLGSRQLFQACATPASSSSPTTASCPIATARSASAGSTGGSTTSGTSITAR